MALGEALKFVTNLGSKQQSRSDMCSRFSSSPRAVSSSHRLQSFAGRLANNLNLMCRCIGTKGGEVVLDLLFVRTQGNAKGFFHIVFHWWWIFWSLREGKAVIMRKSGPRDSHGTA